jgi:hypothetical protein
VDLGGGKGGERLIVGLRVHPETLPRPRAAGAALALVRARLIRQTTQRVCSRHAGKKSHSCNKATDP